MPISNWSTTPGNNNSAPPNGAPEGWASNMVNDTIRQQMADHKTQWLEAEWFNHGDSGLSRASATTFKLTGDVTARYLANRRIKCNDASTLYGSITTSSYLAPDTTVTVSLDSGSLTASLTAVALGILSPSNQSIPVINNLTVVGTASISGAAVFKTTATVEGAATISGAAVFKTTVSVEGEATISGTATFKTVVTGAAIADQAAMEAASAVNRIVTPGRQQYHPSSAKAWVYLFYSGGTPALNQSYNVSSLTDKAVGQATVNFTVAFSAATYCGIAQQQNSGTPLVGNPSINAGNCDLRMRNTSFADSDVECFASFFGDQ
jgi:hypothetical protein